MPGRARARTEGSGSVSVPVLPAKRAEDRMTSQAEAKRPVWRRVVAGVLTALAGVLVFLALATPNNVSRLPEGSSVPEAFVRIPIEALIGIAVLLVLPARVRRVAAIVGGALLGLLTMVKVI